MNKRYYEHTLPIIRGSLSNTYNKSVSIRVIPCLKGNYQVYFDKTSCHNNGRHRSMPHKQRDRKRK